MHAAATDCVLVAGVNASKHKDFLSSIINILACPYSFIHSFILSSFYMITQILTEISTFLSFAGWLHARRQDAMRLAAKRRRAEVMLELLKKLCPPLAQVVDHLWNRHPSSAAVQANVDDAQKALADAAMEGHADCCKVLLTPNTPLDVNWSTSWSAFSSALHMSASCVHTEAVEVLLAFGASPTLTDSDGKTALLLACTATCDFLGFPLNYSDEELLRCVESLIRAGTAVNARTYSGRIAHREAGRYLSHKPELLFRLRCLGIKDCPDDQLNPLARSQHPFDAIPIRQHAWRTSSITLMSQVQQTLRTCDSDLWISDLVSFICSVLIRSGFFPSWCWFLVAVLLSSQVR